MSKAEIISITTRRNALRLGAAASLSAVVIPAFAAPAGPDAELIRLCDRLVANRALEAAAYAANPRGDNERAAITDPLNEEWFQLSDRLYKMESPRTLEGARAMARAALSEIPRDRDGNYEHVELYSLLSMGCVEFVLTGKGA